MEEYRDITSRPADESNEELIHFLRSLLSHWYWILLSVLLFGTAAWLYLRYTEPIYEARAQVIVNEDKSRRGGGDQLSVLNELMGNTGQVENEILVLKTYDLMHTVVLDRGDFISYYAKGNILTTESEKSASPVEVEYLSDPHDIRTSVLLEYKPGLGGEFSLQSEELVLQGQLGDTLRHPNLGTFRLIEKFGASHQNGGSRLIAFSTPHSITTKYRNALTVGLANKNASVVDLSLKYPLREKGQAILYSLIENYIRQNIEEKNIVADSTLSFIDARLSAVGEELATLEDNISHFKRSNQLMDVQSQAGRLVGRSDETIRELARIETELQAWQELRKYLEEDSQARVVPALSLVSDPVFADLIRQYNQLILEYERLRLNNAPGNPALKNVEEQIRRLQGDMLISIRNNLRQLEGVKARYEKVQSDLDKKINSVPSIERGFIDLSRMQEIKQTQYVFLQRAWEETAIGRTSNVSNIKMIDRPRASSTPISPKSKIIYLASIMIGLLVPGGLLYLRELLNVRVRSLEDVQRKSNLPVYGEIGTAPRKTDIVVHSGSRSAIAEQFRALRTNLDFTHRDDGCKTFLVTSGIQGEGKSFVSLNLAITLALLGKRVLLLELDLRKPIITRRLGLSGTRGFSNYIAGHVSALEDILLPSGIEEQLYILPSGPLPPNPSELLLSEAVGEMFATLKAQFDYLVIDAPPVGMVADAFLLGPFADQTLYIVRHDYSYKDQIGKIQELAEEKKLPSTGFVLNDIAPKAGYGYSYGYGYGYYQERESRWWKFGKK